MRRTQPGNDRPRRAGTRRMSSRTMPPRPKDLRGGVSAHARSRFAIAHLPAREAPERAIDDRAP